MKLTHDPVPEQELYDARRDHREMHDLAAHPEHPERVDELRSALDRWLQETGWTLETAGGDQFSFGHLLVRHRKARVVPRAENLGSLGMVQVQVSDRVMVPRQSSGT